VDPAQYPVTVAAAEALTTVPEPVEFLEGLEFMLDGIDHALEKPRAA
jgi:hypothetical protein